jgi:hypothetical protein
MGMGSKKLLVGVQYTMGMEVKIPSIGCRHTMGNGVKNTMGREKNIMGRRVMIPLVEGSIGHM